MPGIFLRALSTDDFDFVYKWHTDEDLYQTLIGPFRFVSKDAEKEWLQNKVKYSNQEINLMICLRDDAQPIGMVSVRDIDWIARVGHFTGLMIGEREYQKKGYGSEALQLLLKYLFQELGLNRIWGFALSDNKPSLKMLEKCGFLIEGHLKQHAYKLGAYKDVSVVGLCSDRFFQQLQETN